MEDHILGEQCKIHAGFVFDNALNPDEFSRGIEYRYHNAIAFPNHQYFHGIYVRAGDVQSLVRLLRVLHIVGDNATLVAYGDLNFAPGASYQVDRSPADQLQQAFQFAQQARDTFFRDGNRKKNLLAALL